MLPSREYQHIDARNVRPVMIAKDEVEAAFRELPLLGIALDAQDVHRMIQGMGAVATMDALQPLVTTPSIATPIQFLQNWLAGFVHIVTQARKIDEVVGISTVGNWEDEKIVQGVMELTGNARPYGDYTNVPLSSWNVNYVERTVVRFEEGMKVGPLEEARSGRANISSADSKRTASTVSLEIQRNTIGFYGFNNGANQTYGFLNDPSLPNYVTVANTGVGNTTTWSTKSFLNICADIRTAVVTLRTQSKDVIDPEKTPMSLILPTNCVDYLTVTSDFGISVRDWMKQTYPNIRVVSAPELNNANGNANVFYLFAEKVMDTSTDDGRTFIQIVPTKFKLMGVQQLAKGYEESYSNATAGVMCKRPYAVVRFTGI